MTTTTAGLVEAARTATASPFTPGRYPYTYAADFLRGNPSVIPTGLPAPLGMSRAQALNLLEMWAALEGRGKFEFASMVADAYLAVWGIRRSDEPAAAPSRFMVV